MNTFNLLFSIALLMPVLSWAEEKSASACVSKCAALSQRIEKLDCGIAISEAEKFLSDGHNLVLAIPRGAPRIHNEIAILRKGLQSRERTMLDCLTKHRDQRKFSDAMLAFMKADFAVEKLSETTETPRHVQEMLVRDYEQAIKTVSNARSK
jgi:hypothetical protein